MIEWYFVNKKIQQEIAMKLKCNNAIHLTFLLLDNLFPHIFMPRFI